MFISNLTVTDFLHQIEGYSQSDFLSSFVTPFLLVKTSPFGQSSIFSTLAADSMKQAAQTGDEVDKDRRRGLLFSIEKSSRNVFAAMVTVGRAANNDIVFNHPSVSKMHAYFKINGDSVTITDFGSKNGTYVEKERLPVKEPKIINSPTFIRFGKIEATFFKPRALFAYLEEVLSSEAITSA